jgi:hypothetical protein
MSVITKNVGRSSLVALQPFVRKPHERTDMCELCAAPLTVVHQHLLELQNRRIACACDACAILFSGHTAQRYRRIPRDIRVLRDFAMDDQEWESLLIPINLAFLFYSSAAGRVIANYPSPGGAMESLLDLEYWSAIIEHNPVLKKLEPDVEALLVNRLANPPQYYRVPIDQCFRLVGIIRKHWHGLSGGSEVWKHVDDFFGQLNQTERA